MLDREDDRVSSTDLTARESLVAQGVALIDRGASQRHAAAAVGLPRTTLQAAYHRLRPGRMGREEARRAADERICDHAQVLVEEGFRQLAEDMFEGRIQSAKERAVVTGIAADKLSVLRGWRNDSQSDGSVLDRVMDRLSSMSGKVTLSVEPHPGSAPEGPDGPIDVVVGSGADEGE